MSLAVRLHHAFGPFRLDVAFSAPHGITALFGRSGTGKTTIINAIAGLLRPASGRISLGDTLLFDSERRHFLPPHRRGIGTVFQEGRLFPHLSVRKNLVYAGRFLAHPPPPDDIDRVVDLLGIGHLMQRQPAALSGGEKQRVAIGRALLSQPRLLLMDEPLASLDEARKSEILPFLQRLRDEVAIPIVYVTHSVSEVARLATTIIALSDGRVARAGPAAEVLADPDLFPLMGRQEAGAIIPGRVVGHHDDGLTEVAVSGGRLLMPRITAAPGTELRLRIRARDITLSLTPLTGISALNCLPVTIRKVGASDGPIVDIAIRCGQDDLLVRLTRRSVGHLQLTPGTACFAILKAISFSQRDIGLVPGPP
ncbi:MAG: molybdenum ABC transporter ATP-binding protein [Hyphomicrobiaceae bacterium]|nr:molybdenum ABC transporter ATP-binding protein [Hyphomicrobiaceae bacterium]